MERTPSCNRALERLRQNDGFTLGEVLVTVLLVGLLTLAIATGIGAAVGAYGNIRAHSEEQAVLNNAVTAVTDELRFAYDVSKSADFLAGTGNDVQALVFSSTVRDARLYLGNEDGVVTLFGAGAGSAEGASPEQDVQSGTPVPLPLVNTAADKKEAPGLTASLTKLSYDDGLWTFSVTVTGGADPLASGDITVRAINNW